MRLVLLCVRFEAFSLNSIFPHGRTPFTLTYFRGNSEPKQSLCANRSGAPCAPFVFRTQRLATQGAAQGLLLAVKQEVGAHAAQVKAMGAVRELVVRPGIILHA